MQIEIFAMERMQSLHEHDVEINLSESGVEPLRVKELLTSERDVERLLAQPLGYTQSAGPTTLRERIADWYPGAKPENVTVTNGGAEANYTALWTLLEQGDEAAIMLPNYLQTWGLARAFAHARSFRLCIQSEGSRRRWALDLDTLRRAVTPRTKLIIITNPNNPTGSILSADEMTAEREGQQHRCHRAQQRRQAIGPDGGALAITQQRHRRCLQPIDARRLLVARLVLEADAKEIAALEHLPARLREARLVAIGHRQRGNARKIKRQRQQHEQQIRPPAFAPAPDHEPASLGFVTASCVTLMSGRHA